MERNPWFKALLVLLTIIAAQHVLWLAWSLATQFADIIMLFFLAWLVAFILNPVAGAVVRAARLPRLAAAALVYAAVLTLVIAGILLAAPLVAAQLAQLGKAIPAYAATIPERLAFWQSELLRLGITVDLNSLYKTDRLPTDLQQWGTVVVQNAVAWATGAASLLFNTFIVLMLSFYFTLDGPRIGRQMMRITPKERRPELRYLLESIDQSFGGFVRGQVALALLCAAVTAIVMYVAGLNYLLIVTIYVFVVMLIPFIGPFLALAPPVLIAFLQLPTPNAVVVAVLLIAVQSAVLNILSPKIMGDALGMHPLVVFLAMLAGAKVAGVAGAIFGVPVAAVVHAMIVFTYRRNRRAPTSRPRRRAATGSKMPAWQARLLRRVISQQRRSVSQHTDQSGIDGIPGD